MIVVALVTREAELAELSFAGSFVHALCELNHQEEEQERVRREFEAQLEAVSQLDLLQKEERAR